MSKSPRPEPTRRHKRKFQLESIHVEELLNAAGMSGYLGVLDPPQETAPHLQKLAAEALSELSSTGEVLPERYQQATVALRDIATDDKRGAPEKGAPETGIPERGVPSPGVVVTGTPETGIPVSVQRTHTIRQAIRVQDGHSLGEQLVYETLWSRSQPLNEETRTISIGYRTLSAFCRLTVNNCKANLASLSQKLAIEPSKDHSPTCGRTYLVYSYNAILRRRRSAGMTHFIKTKGVLFVDPLTGLPLDETGVPVSGTPVLISGTPVSDKKGTPDPGALSLEKYIQREAPPRSPTSSSIAPLASTPLHEALLEVSGTTDDELVRRLMFACLQRDPEATPEEVAALIRYKAEQLRNTDVRNLAGLLAVAVPKCYEGPLVAKWRARKAEESGAESAQPLGWEVEEARRLAADTSAPAEDRDFARQFLASGEGKK